MTMETKQDDVEADGSEVRAQAGRGGHMPQVRSTPIVLPNQVASMPVRMTGFNNLPAHNVLDMISRTNSMMVVQALEPLEIATGIETPNQYVVHDMYCRPIMNCMERSNGFARQMQGSHRSFAMMCTDLFGAHVMQCHRDQPWGSFTDHLTTQFLGQNIGIMSRTHGDVNFHLLGAGSNQSLLIRSPLFAASGGTRSFPVMTYNGMRVGEIVRLYPGYMQEMYSDADTYIVHFPMDLPPILKLLLISSVFLIDFTFFENNGQQNNMYRGYGGSHYVRQRSYHSGFSSGYFPGFY